MTTDTIVLWIAHVPCPFLSLKMILNQQPAGGVLNLRLYFNIYLKLLLLLLLLLKCYMDVLWYHLN